MNITISKAGIHCIGPKRTGYDSFLNRINAAGRRLSIVKCRDDFGAIMEPLALWPDMVTVGAKTEWDDAGYNVNVAFKNITSAAKKNPKVAYWEYFNERNGDWEEQANLYIALMPRLDAVGIHLCLFNCASGTPFRTGEGNGEGDFAYAQIARACKHARDNGYDALLGLHEYVSSGETIGRFATLADYLEQCKAFIPIVITEYGFETYPGATKFMRMVKAQDPIYTCDPRVIGCALWTLGGGGWAGSNYQAALPVLAEYIVTAAATS